MSILDLVTIRRMQRHLLEINRFGLVVFKDVRTINCWRLMFRVVGISTVILAVYAG